MTASEKWENHYDLTGESRPDGVLADLAARERERDEARVAAQGLLRARDREHDRAEKAEAAAQYNADTLDSSSKQLLAEIQLRTKAEKERDSRITEEQRSNLVEKMCKAEARLAKMREACEALMEYEKAMDGADGCGENDDLYWKAVKACDAALAGKEDSGE